MARKLVSFSVPVSVSVSVSACVEMYLYLHAACCMLHSIHWKPQIDAYHLQGTRQTRSSHGCQVEEF